VEFSIQNWFEMSQQVLHSGPTCTGCQTELWYGGLEPCSVVKCAMVRLGLEQEGDICDVQINEGHPSGPQWPGLGGPWRALQTYCLENQLCFSKRRALVPSGPARTGVVGLKKKGKNGQTSFERVVLGV